MDLVGAMSDPHSQLCMLGIVRLQQVEDILAGTSSGTLKYGCISYIKLHLKGVLQCIIVADIQLEPILEKHMKKWRQNGSKCTLRTLPPDSKCTLRKQVNT